MSLFFSAPTEPPPMLQVSLGIGPNPTPFSEELLPSLFIISLFSL
jgi:hypothetical protein